MEYSVKKIKDERYADFEKDYGLFDAYLPETEEAVPVFVYFHGGGLENGSKGQDEAFTQLAEQGIAVFDVNYRMYPDVGFPAFVEDCAYAIAFLREHQKEYGNFSKWYIGGSSAGGWLSMMLAYDKHYLAAHGIDSERDIAGYLHDAGQPTTHFNVLRERGLSTRAIRVDEAAPLYFIDHIPENPETLPVYKIIVSEFDIVGRYEQTQVLMRTLRDFQYPEEKLIYQFMPGYSHCQYCRAKKEDGTSVFAEMILDLICHK